MITECEYPDCENVTDMPFKCSRCKRNFCAEHRLPENHACSLNTYNPDHQRAYFRQKVGSMRRGLSGDSTNTEEVEMTSVNPTAHPDNVRELEYEDDTNKFNDTSETSKYNNTMSYYSIIVRQLVVIFYISVILLIISVTYGLIST